MKNILLVFGAASLTGAGKMGLSFANQFAKDGHRVLLVAPRAEPAFGEAVSAAGASLATVGSFRGYRAFFALLQMLRLIARHRPACIVSMFQLDVKFCVIASIITGRPLIISGQSMTTFYGGNLVRRLKRHAYWSLAKCADLYVCTSGPVEQQALQEGVSGARIMRLPNGIPQGPRFSPTRSLQQACSIPGPAITVAMVGRLDPQKAQHVAFEAVGRCRHRTDIHLVVIGGPTAGNLTSLEYSHRLTSLASELQLEDRVHFLGWRLDVDEILADCDFFLHSAAWEGFPLAVLEAMMAGKPVVITECFGFFDHFVEGVHGRLVPVADSVALASAIDWMIDQGPAQMQRIGNAARSLVLEHYEISQIAARFTAAALSLR